uniref:Alpha-galactosidase n=1 Tax=Onchocerca volvulus TaxID=6282 RepID=A0A8R1TWT8_ONCVO
MIRENIFSCTYAPPFCILGDPVMNNQYYILLYLAAIANFVEALENGLARTPPMGWMSWTKFYCQMDCVQHPFTCINEKLYMDMADRMVEDGYLQAGYQYVHIDDCWMERQRDQDNRLIPDRQRFPNGIAALADYMHQRGLKLGIYEDYGTATCAGFPGSYQHTKIDADTFAKWQVDYLKLDGCNINVDLMPNGYAEMGRMLNSTGRPIVYSCSWPAYLINHPEKVDYELIGEHCNLWRNFDDIKRSWDSVRTIIAYYDHHQDKHIPAQGPGRWHDPDMIIVGNTELTVDQAKVQMSIWSIWSSPLIMSNDLRLIAPVFRDILLNKRVIAINQDPFGIMGRLVANTTNIGIYVKPVIPAEPSAQRYSYAVAIFNRNLYQRMNVRFLLSKVGLTNPEGYFVQDLWNGELKGLLKPNDFYSTNVNPTGIDFFKATLANL